MDNFSESSLREWKQEGFIIAYVEVDNPNFDNIKRFQGVETYQNYYKKGKIIAKDFFFDYRKRNTRARVIKRLEELLGVKLQKV